MDNFDLAKKVKDLIKDVSLDDQKTVLDLVYTGLRIQKPSSSSNQEKSEHPLDDSFSHYKVKNNSEKLLVSLMVLAQEDSEGFLNSKTIQENFEKEGSVFVSNFPRDIEGLITKKFVLKKGEGKSTKYKISPSGKKELEKMKDRD